MPYHVKTPDAPVLAQQAGLSLYAYRSSNPFFATVRLISDAPLIGRRQSFWLQWMIPAQTIVTRGDGWRIKKAHPYLLPWMARQLAEVYPADVLADEYTPDQIADMQMALWKQK